MATKKLPDQAYLRECFDYDPETGVLTWRERPQEHFLTIRGWRVFRRQYSWKRAGGTTNTTGYRIVVLDDINYLEHRLIYKLVTGADPSAEIDHKNRCRADNRFRNLRPATHLQNGGNVPQRSLPTKVRGVRKHGRGWATNLRVDGTTYYLSIFDTQEEAYAAYCKKGQELRGEFFPADQSVFSDK